MLAAALLLSMAHAALALKDTGKVCVADLGSNSLKIEVGEIFRGEYVQHHLSKKVVGVGDDMSATGRISEGKLAEIGRVLSVFAKRCAKSRVSRRLAVATAAYREASNGQAVADLAAKHGFPLEIASGERESELAYLSCTLGRPGLGVVDIGSRTVELVTRDEAGATLHQLRQLGYRVSFKGFFEKARTFREAAEAYRAELAKELADVSLVRGKPELLGLEIGKPARYLRGRGKIHGVRLGLAEIEAKVLELESQGEKEYRKLKMMEDADGILPRLVLLQHLLRGAEQPAVTVIDRELGAGVIAELAR